MSEVEVRDLPFDPARPWVNLARYAAYDENGILFVRRPDTMIEYTEASYCVSEVHERYPHLSCGPGSTRPVAKSSEGW